MLTTPSRQVYPLFRVVHGKLFLAARYLARLPEPWHRLRIFHARRRLCWFDTIHVVCKDLLCLVCFGLLYAEFSTVNAGLDRPMFWKPLCLLSTPNGLVTTNYQPT